MHIFLLLLALDQQAVIAEAREIALHYTQSLPNFICDQETERYANYHGEKKNGKFNRLDRYTARLTYNGKKEEYQVIAIQWEGGP